MYCDDMAIPFSSRDDMCEGMLSIIVMTMDLYLLPVNNDKLLSLPLLPLPNKGEEDTEKRMLDESCGILSTYLALI